MNQAGESLYEESKAISLKVDTRFRGTRSNPECLGSITNISDMNFQPNHLILGFLEGISRELYQFYQSFIHTDTSSKGKIFHLIGSGNGLRKNPLLRKICSDMFEKELTLSSLPEEAACGSAFLAAKLAKESF
jgi:sedoheptulokinase